MVIAFAYIAMTYPDPTPQQLEYFSEHGWLVVADSIAQRDLDELERHCERIIDEKETLAYDWAWDAKESKAKRSFRIVQGSPTKVWDDIAGQPYRHWLVRFGSALMHLPMEFWYDQFLAKPKIVFMSIKSPTFYETRVSKSSTISLK